MNEKPKVGSYVRYRGTAQVVTESRRASPHKVRIVPAANVTDEQIAIWREADQQDGFVFVPGIAVPFEQLTDDY